MFVEERVIWLAMRVFDAEAREVGLHRARASLPARTARLHRDQAEYAREILALRFGHPWSLEELARRIGTSVFHLCRVFRRYTGPSVHEYRTALRLRHALARLPASRATVTLRRRSDAHLG